MFVAFAWFLVIIGFLGLLTTFMVVYKKMNSAQLSMEAVTGAIREHTQGLSWKWPTATLQQPEIDMRASVILTSGGIHVMSWEEFVAKKSHDIKPRAYETSDGVLFGTWATALMPLKGYLNNMVKKSPASGALMTLAKIELAMSEKIHTMNTEEALGKKKEIGDFVANIFEGEDKASPHEKAYGMSVLNPELFDLNFGKRAQDAAEKKIEARMFRESVQDMLASAGNDPDKARSAVEVSTGMAKRNILQLEGLETALKTIAESFFKGGK